MVVLFRSLDATWDTFEIRAAAACQAQPPQLRQEPELRCAPIRRWTARPRGACCASCRSAAPPTPRRPEPLTRPRPAAPRPARACRAAPPDRDRARGRRDRPRRACGGCRRHRRSRAGASPTCRIEDVARLLEGAEAVGVEHLGPEIAVIGRGIAVAREDVLEMRRAVAHHHRRRHVDLRRGGCPRRLPHRSLSASGSRCASRSYSAEETYSTVAKPWLKRAARQQLVEQRPRASARRCDDGGRSAASTSGCSSQCS